MKQELIPEHIIKDAKGETMVRGGELVRTVEQQDSVEKAANPAFRDLERPKTFLRSSIGPYTEWVQACRTDTPAMSNFEFAGWLTEADHLGNVA